MRRSSRSAMPVGDHRLARIRDRTEGRTVTASSTGDAILVWLIVLASLLLAWFASYLAGGSKTAMPHLFYVPVVISAVRFGSRRGFVVALAAGLASGPLLPLDVDAGSDQLTANWLIRLVLFVLIGQLTAYLSSHSMPLLTTEMADRRFRAEVVEALRLGRMRMVYQPIIDLEDGSITGVEALIRWDDPERGVIPPDDFIPRAERTGCIGEITRFVVDEVTQQAATWREGPLAHRDSFIVAVNVSGSDVSDGTLYEHITTRLVVTAVPTYWLHLEVTETALVEDVSAAVEGLTSLHRLGICLAIDDFGTGESSLGNLHRFPVDVLKIDRVFVEQLERDERGTALAQGVIALAHAMELVALAEGIETAHQARTIRDLGCDLAQGYLFSWPLRPEDLTELLRDPEAVRAANRVHLGLPAGVAAPDVEAEE